MKRQISTCILSASYPCRCGLIILSDVPFSYFCCMADILFKMMKKYYKRGKKKKERKEKEKELVAV